MDINGKLVFSEAPDGTGRLVFGELGGAVVVPEAVVSIDADLPGLGVLTLRAGAVLGMDAELPGLDGSVGLAWDANVSRDGLRSEMQTAWQQAQPVARALVVGWRESAPLRAAAIARWQGTERLHGGLVAAWQATRPVRGAVVSHWQSGERLRATLEPRWQEAVRRRGATATHWQAGTQRRTAVATHWQELRRLRAAAATHWQAAGVPMRAALVARWSPGVPVWLGLQPHWQEAMRPRPGVSPKPPLPPKPPPCYDPATIARLIFTDLALGDGRLVFVCQRAGQVVPPAGVVVLPRRSYIVINSLSLVRVSDGAPIHTYTFGMSLDVDSWTWQWQATLHASALDLITPAVGDDPVEVLATVNGQPFRLVAEGYSRQRQFANTRISVRGRGRAAILDAPCAPVFNFGSAVDRTAQQLANEVLMINGVPIGWAVDWRLTDWLVPGNVWTHQGPYIGALLDIAEGGGGYVQPHDTDAALIIQPRYPAAPWNWAAVAPDFELPSAVVSVEGIEWQRKATYNQVHVSGINAGVMRQITRAGTAGDAEAPMVTHALITADAAASQRGTVVLGDTGLQAIISLRLPVLPQTGVIKPGAMVRYVDGATTHLGLVRSTQLDWQAPTLRQTLSVETHPA